MVIEVVQSIQSIQKVLDDFHSFWPEVSGEVMCSARFSTLSLILLPLPFSDLSVLLFC